MDDRQSAQSLIQRELLISTRLTAQLTQAQLSIKLNRPQSYVSKYESGARKLTLVEIREIAICCGQSLIDFVDMFEQELQLNSD